MADLTEVEMAVTAKLREKIHNEVRAGLVEAGQAVPAFPRRDTYRAMFLDAQAHMEADTEYEAKLQAEARDLLLAAIAALDASTKEALGIGHLDWGAP